MSLNHGINTTKEDTNFSTVATASVGIPFFVGAFPCHLGEGYKGVPQIAYSYDEAESAFGYSDDWSKWTLCEAMYTQFKMFGVGPAIFMNVFDPATNKKAVAAASFAVADHIATIDDDAIIDDSLEVKSGETTLVKGTDYEAYYEGTKLIVEVLSGGEAYSVPSLSIAYNKADFTEITADVISTAVEKVEQCKARFGIVPDLICAPGWSKTPAVAAVMAAKAGSIGGIFRAKAVVDLDTTSAGADSFDDVVTYKKTNGYTDENEIVCWPLATDGTHTFSMSTIVCGRISATDYDNNDIPYESPSNKSIAITGCVNAAGEEILLSIAQADTVSVTAGAVTAINYDGWVLWGNYTGAVTSTDVAKKFICTSRMMDYICNSFASNYWSYIDKPLSRVLIDAIVNSFNSFLAALTNSGALFGGEIAYVEDNNSTAELIAGKFRLDTTMASPTPAERIDMFVEFDVDLLTEALNG